MLASLHSLYELSWILHWLQHNDDTVSKHCHASKHCLFYSKSFRKIDSQTHSIPNKSLKSWKEKLILWTKQTD